ncbi:V-type ATPase subunit [Sporosalibacterium faouarense]|uniref:V-type ATPase subunit n=1 Tax=Sporosalibacterium faouarense TaxID=516123 RepID=UPI00141C363E|nr:V-type ATPase subunit [Sporosalibacterium faouarense]MTI48774.1 V-type ATPase subunit [Bacillota bacterium]
MGMGSVKDFAAINTKIRALKGKMLDEKDYLKLISKKSVPEIAEYLKNNTYYTDVLKDEDIKNIHRNRLELLFKKHIIIQFEKILHHFTGEYRKLFKILFMRYEIEDLKLYIRALSRGESLEEVKKLVLYSGIYSSIDHDLLITSKSISEFVRNLKGTIYYDGLKGYQDEQGSKLTFYLEMNLDILYFTKLYEQAGSLDKKNEKILKELLGKNIDLLNLEWIYRGIKFYKLSPEELINYTLNGGYSLSFNDIKNLCYSKDEKELIERMINSQYGFLFDNEDTLDLFMERRIERYLYFQFLGYYRKERMNITQSIAYIHLLEYEIRDIISITEAIRYDLDKSQVKSYLVRKIEGSDL